MIFLLSVLIFYNFIIKNKMENNSIITIIINYIILQYIKIANYNFLSLPYIVITNIFNINISINSNANKQSCKNRKTNTHFLFLYYMLISIQLALGIERMDYGKERSVWLSASSPPSVGETNSINWAGWR